MLSFVTRNAIFRTLLIASMLMPTAVSAISLNVAVPEAPVIVGDTVVIPVVLSDINPAINTLDGSIQLCGSGILHVKEIGLGNSAFALWPTAPVYNSTARSIRFTGGVPGGTTDESATVLHIIAQAERSGTCEIRPGTVTAYQHDGKATPVIVTSNAVVLEVKSGSAGSSAADNWQQTIEQDTQPPAPFVVTLDRHFSVFDNKYFISFFATDAESGVAYYEVQEGDGKFVQAESPYVLADQSLSQSIRVRAVDRAGNERTVDVVIPASAVPVSRVWMWASLILGAIVMSGIGFLVRQKFVKK